MIEDRWGIKITEEDAATTRSLADLVRLVTRKARGRPAVTLRGPPQPPPRAPDVNALLALPRTSSGRMRRGEALRRYLAGELAPPRKVTALGVARAAARSALAYALARLGVGIAGGNGEHPTRPW